MVKVLIIDDSAFQRKILSHAVSDLGYEVITANNGREGIDCAVKEDPEVIITDLLMPEYDGFWVLEQLKARKIPIPAIIITSDVQTTTMDRCRNMGAVAFLNKPVKKENIQSAISIAIAGREL